MLQRRHPMKALYKNLIITVTSILLIFTVLPSLSVEAKTKKRRVKVDNNPTITMYVGETIELYVKKNPESIRGWGTSGGGNINRSWNNGENSKVTITAVAPGLADAYCWDYENPAPVHECYITIKEFGIQNTTVYLGWPTKLEFYGAEAETYSCKKNKYFTLKADGTIKPKKVTKKPVNVTVTCADGKQYIYGITVAEKEFTVYEPGEDQWGLLCLHDREYDYIPEMTFYNVNDVETYAECLQEAMRHGADKLRFLDSPAFNTVTSNWNYSGSERIKNAYYSSGIGNACIGGYEINPEKVSFEYLTASEIKYSMMLKGYTSFEQRVAMGREYDVSHYYAVYDGATEVAKKAIAEEGTVKDVVNNICMQLIALNKHIKEQDFHYCHEACGLFMTGEAVCSGYADALSLCLTILGIDNGVVQSIDCGHAFNAVWLDGDWLYYDLTCSSQPTLGVPYEFYVPYIEMGCESSTPNQISPIVNGPYYYYDN